MKLAMIGAGRLGEGLGLRLSAAGHEIVFGVRDPVNAKYADLIAHKQIVMATPAQAIDDADYIFLATPWEQTQSALAALGKLDGRVLVDCTNPVSFGADGPALAIDPSTSASEIIASWAPGAHVFKSFNHLGSAIIKAPDRFVVPPLVALAGEDGRHKDRLLELIAEIGFTPQDAGPLRNARLLEAMAILWMTARMKTKGAPDTAFAMLSAPD